MFFFFKVELDHPEYRSRYKSTQQLVNVEFSSLQVKLHQEALLNIIELSTKMLPPRYSPSPILNVTDPAYNISANSCFFDFLKKENSTGQRQRAWRIATCWEIWWRTPCFFLSFTYLNVWRLQLRLNNVGVFNCVLRDLYATYVVPCSSKGK